MSGGIVGLLLVVGMILLYVGTYVLNKNVAVPEGIEPVDKCSTCGSGSCSIRLEETFKKSGDDECDLYEAE